MEMMEKLKGMIANRDFEGLSRAQEIQKLTAEDTWELFSLAFQNLTTQTDETLAQENNVSRLMNAVWSKEDGLDVKMKTVEKTLKELETVALRADKRAKELQDTVDKLQKENLIQTTG